MSLNREISHRGRVLSVTPEMTSVEIISESACSACHAKGLCSMSESKAKIVEVPSSGWDNFQPGEEVTVSLRASMGHKAVWVAYVIPLFLMMAVLLGLVTAGLSELMSGLISIASVALYYAAVWLFGARLKNEYVFNIKHL